MGEQRRELLNAFTRLAARCADRVLVQAVDRQATVGEIDRLSHAISEHALSALGDSTLVGLSLPNGPAFLAGLLAILRSGHTALLLDAMAPAEDQARAMFAHGAVGALRSTTAWPKAVTDVFVAAAELHTHRSPPLQGAVVKLTSGSTGVPHGVLMSDTSLLTDEAALTSTMALAEDDRFLAMIPWSHSYGFTTLVLSALTRGVVLVLPTDTGPLSPLTDGQLLGATVFPTVPAYIQVLLKMARPPALPETMRLVISAGAPLPAAAAREFRRRYGQSARVFYGSSECGGVCYDREGGAGERGTVGTPVDGVRISLADSPDCGPGAGLVTVESPAVGTRYLRGDSDVLGGGKFQTCDVGSWLGGELVLGARADRMINVRGRKVDPAEVESVLVKFDGVDEAVVLGAQIREGKDEAVRAVLVTSGRTIPRTEIVAWCRSQLAEHKVPRSIVLVPTLPRTARGKIDHAALRRLPAADQGPVGSDD